MKKNIRSYLNSLIIIFIFYFATRGIVKLFWNHKDSEVVKARTFLLVIILFACSFIYIIVTYHIFGYTNTVIFYKTYLFLAFIYLIVGIIYDSYYINKKTTNN